MMKKFILLIIACIILTNLISATQWSENARTEFITFNTGNLPYCSVSDSESFWSYNSQIYDSFSDCYRKDGENTNKCCPLIGGYSCNQDTNKCESSNINYCSDYTSQSACENFDLSSAINDVESARGEGFCRGSYTYQDAKGCIIYPQCVCKWEDNKCTGTWTPVNKCDGTSDLECYLVKTELSNCSLAGKMINYDEYYKKTDGSEIKCSADKDCIGISIEPLSCVDGKCISDNCKPEEKTVPCIYTALDAESVLSMIIAVFLIIIFYILFLRKQKKRRR